MSDAQRSAAVVLLSSFLGACALAACSADPGSADDAGGLPDVDVHTDGGRDATAGDASHLDGGVDGTVGDSAIDAGDASTVDGGIDAADAGRDGAADTGSDAPSEASADAAQEASNDAAGETGSDANVEASADAGDAAVLVPPTCDGVINAGEYGAHTDGQNQQTSGGQVWYATWDDTRAYFAVAGANTAEGSVVYVSSAPAIGIDAGTNANGTLTGFAYDGETIATLPLHAQLVAYVKASYNETRTSDGAGGWNAAQAAQLTVCANGTTREFSIPWATIGGARPAAFGWFGLVTSSGGFVYGEVPMDNPGGAIGANATYPFYYLVANATPVTGDKPFATKLSR